MVQALADAAVLRHLRVLLGAKAFEHSSDADLLRRLIDSRDEAAFAALVRRHGGRVLSVCRNVLPCEADAEDAFQATFLVLARKAVAVRKQKSVASWLFGVALRLARNLRKKAMRRSQVERAAEVKTSSESPVTRATLNELRSCLDEEIAALPEKYRAPFLLCCLDGKSRTEAAQVLSCKEGTLASRLATAREKLQKRLTARGVSLPAALAAVAVAPGGSSATIPASLAIRTADAVIAYLGGNAAGVVSSQVLGIAASALKGMLMSKMKVGLALVFAASLSVLAANGLQPDEEGASVNKAAARGTFPQISQQKPATETMNPPRVDASDDPLPEGAVIRLGTKRFRHEGEAGSVVFSADGKWIVSHSNSGVTVWDAATGIERYTLPALRQRGGAFSGLAIGPDGTSFATRASAAAKDPDKDHANVITIWELATGNPLRSLSAPKEDTESQMPRLQYSGDGKYLAVAQFRGKAVVYDLATGKHRPIVEGLGPDTHAYNIAVAPDSRTIAVAIADMSATPQFDQSVRLWDIATGKFIRIIHEFPISDRDDEKTNNFIRALAFSRDGSTLAVGTLDAITLCETATGKKAGRLVAKMGQPTDLAFTADNQYLVSGTESDGKLRKWELASGHAVLVKGGGYLGRSMALSPDDKTVAIGTHGNTLRFWDLASGTERFTEFQSHDSAIKSVAVSPDGKTIVSAGGNKHILWDTATCRRTGALPGVATGLSFSPDGTWLSSTGYDAKVRLWNRSENLKDSSFIVPDLSHVESALFSADSKTLFTLNSKWEKNNKVRYRVIHWDPATSKQTAAWELPEGTRPVLLAADGRTAVVYANEIEFGIHDAPSGRRLSLPEIKSTQSISLSPDMRVLALGVYDHDPNGTVRLMETATGQEVFARTAHQGQIDVLAWSSDGRFLASGDADEREKGVATSIRLWDTANGRELANFKNLASNVSALAFAPNDKTLIAGFSNGTALVFDIAKFDPRPSSASKLKNDELESCWLDLAANAATAQQAKWRFVDTAKHSMPFLRSRLKPIPVADVASVAKLIADLDSGTFAVREAATKQLKALGEQAESGLRAALKEGLPLETRRRLSQLLDDAPNPETLRSIRAIAVLERIGNTESTGVLDSLSKGTAGVRTTEEAAAALARIRAKSAATRTP